MIVEEEEIREWDIVVEHREYRSMQKEARKQQRSKSTASASAEAERTSTPVLTEVEMQEMDDGDDLIAPDMQKRSLSPSRMAEEEASALKRTRL